MTDFQILRVVADIIVSLKKDNHIPHALDFFLEWKSKTSDDSCTLVMTLRPILVPIATGQGERDLRYYILRRDIRGYIKVGGHSIPFDVSYRGYNAILRKAGLDSVVYLQSPDHANLEPQYPVMKSRGLLTLFLGFKKVAEKRLSQRLRLVHADVESAFGTHGRIHYNMFPQAQRKVARESKSRYLMAARALSLKIPNPPSYVPGNAPRAKKMPKTSSQLPSILVRGILARQFDVAAMKRAPKVFNNTVYRMSRLQ
jgi:hypothetical protein